jgi:hypothetical protein
MVEHWLAICTLLDNRRWTNVNPPNQGSSAAIHAKWTHVHDNVPHFQVEELTYLPRPHAQQPSKKTLPRTALFKRKADSQGEGPSPKKTLITVPINPITPSTVSHTDNTATTSNVANDTATTLNVANVAGPEIEDDNDDDEHMVTIKIEGESDKKKGKRRAASKN